ncbi:MAG: tyrosine-type recombinase/integrase [Acetobacteraceae bacterium]|nr:tyrosine-type recombinase/integrase [Acetobacteraceae bacterium]
MSPLGEELDRYLAVRRGLGFDLDTSARILRRFVAFAEEAGAAHVSTALFLRWQEGFGRAGRQTWAARLGIVRRFAEWLHGLDQAHEVPPAGLIPSRARRRRPHIYAAGDVARIVAAAVELPSPYGLRGLTHATLIGLIAATGLRVSEALALDAGDVDLAAGVLTVRQGKFGKARLVPLHPSATERLRAYAAERDRLLGRPAQPFFVGEHGRRVSDCSARYNFALVCQQLGLRPPQRERRHGRGPRIHDLRHTFAARVIVGWYRTGQDAAREMIRLTSYLGHARPEHTYWYIEAVPELLALAAARVEGTPDGEAAP